MSKSRKSYSASLKTQVVLEVLQGYYTINELAKKYEIHPNQIKQWKRQAVEGIPSLFERGKPQYSKDQEELTDRLYQQIGQLQVEVNWLKKKSNLFV